MSKHNHNLCGCYYCPSTRRSVATHVVTRPGNNGDTAYACTTHAVDAPVEAYDTIFTIEEWRALDEDYDWISDDRKFNQAFDQFFGALNNTVH